VILITTKQGQVGKTKVELNAYAGINGWATLPEMRSGDSYMQVLRDANAAIGNWSSPADDSKMFSSAAAYQAAVDGKYLNWPKLLMQNALTQNYSLSVSGGTQKTKAYISFNFDDENGQYEGDNYKNYSTNMRIDHKVNNWLSIGANTQASYVYQNKAYAKLLQAMTANPLGEAYDADGNINITPVLNDASTINLLLNQKGGVYKNQNQNFKFFFNPYIEIRPVKGLSILSRVGADLEFLRNNYFQGMGSYQYYNQSGVDATGTNANVYAQVNNQRDYNYKWENIVTYNFNIAQKHDFTLMAATSWEHQQYDQQEDTQTNIQVNRYLW
jgi:hypothetical protein